jgi:hypothetical protein
VLALLLVRRRVLRHDAPSSPADKPSATGDVQTMTVFCPLRDEAYEVTVVMPSDERIEEIQSQLSELLVSGTESTVGSKS